MGVPLLARPVLCQVACVCVCVFYFFERSCPGRAPSSASPRVRPRETRPSSLIQGRRERGKKGTGPPLSTPPRHLVLIPSRRCSRRRLPSCSCLASPSLFFFFFLSFGPERNPTHLSSSRRLFHVVRTILCAWDLPPESPSPGRGFRTSPAVRSRGELLTLKHETESTPGETRSLTPRARNHLRFVSLNQERQQVSFRGVPLWQPSSSCRLSPSLSLAHPCRTTSHSWTIRKRFGVPFVFLV